LLIRSCAPFGVVGLVLLHMGACYVPDLSTDEELALPDRADPIDPGDVARPDTNRPDTAVADASVEADADAAPGLRVFLSSAPTNGNLGGLAGADLRCKTLATAAGLGGNWAAWLSNHDNGPHAIDRVTSAGPWRLVSGEIIADTKAQLSSGAIKHAIDHDEKGVAVVAARVWTGTGPNGQYSTNDCDRWTSGNDGDGRVGANNAADTTWTSMQVDGCGGQRHIYCFQL
jgi:hypothetical protein